MNINKWLVASRLRLERATIKTARLDCLLLLERVIEKDRSWVLAHPEYELSEANFHDLEELLARREKHEPIAYILGKSEFYGRQFEVNHHVLEPRPESETIIELLKTELRDKNQEIRNTCIVDVGTGSGALAITAKLEIPNAKVIGVDIDPDCIGVAKQNARKLDADVTFLEGDLLVPLQNSEFRIQNSVVLANLPYVPTDYPLNPAAKHEPELAIFGGADGLELYRRMFEQTKTLNICPAIIITESLPSQHIALINIAQNYGYTQSKEDDFIQVFRA